MLYKFGFKCWSSLTYLDPELSRMSKTAFITSWRLQRSILQEETQRKVESKTNFKRSALTKPKPTSLFFMLPWPFCCCFPAFTQCQRNSENKNRLKDLQPKSQCQWFQTSEQAQDGASLVSWDKKGGTQKTRPQRKHRKHKQNN